MPREGTGAEYQCRFSALNSHQPFRAERITPKPIVQGPQTAITVGPAGETIYTDKFGRVKVQFHWDRYGKRDDKSSCWIRVSQNWGGKGWGGMFIPHIGQEVIVQFLEGDPDMPLITGTGVQRGEHAAVELPAGKTQSIIRDHGGNEIIMEGAAGGQQMRLFSPTHDTWCHLGNSIKFNSKSDWDVTIGGYELVEITGPSTRKVGGDAYEQIKENYHHKVVSGNHTLDVVAGSFQETVKSHYTTTVTSGNMTIAVNAGSFTETVKGAYKTTVVSGDMTVDVTAGKYKLTTGSDISIEAGGNYRRKSGHDDEFFTGRSIKRIIGSSEEYPLAANLSRSRRANPRTSRAARSRR